MTKKMAKTGKAKTARRRSAVKDLPAKKKTGTVKGGSGHTGAINVALGDGSVRFVK